MNAPANNTVTGASLSITIYLGKPVQHLIMPSLVV